MKLAMVTAFPDSPLTIDGGVAGAAKYLIDELKNDPALDLSVVVPKCGIGEVRHEDWGGVKIYRVGKDKLWSFLPGIIYDLLIGRSQIARLIKEINPDLVHYQGGLYLAKNCSRLNIVTIHGIAENDALWDRKWKAFWWIKWIALKLTEAYSRRGVRNAILISDYVRAFLPRQKSGIRYWRINNPIAGSFFEVTWHCSPGRVFCCSRVRPIKNILGLIKAFTAVAQKVPGAELRIAGVADPVYLQACQNEVGLNNLQSKVHFLGPLTISEIQSELQNANCLAMPSFQENAPLAIAEAMAVGVPVVGARVGGIPEMVEHGRTGFLVDPYNAVEISEAICKVLQDTNMSSTMSTAAKQFARAHFSASTISKQTCQAYQDLISGSGSPNAGERSCHE